MLVEFAIIILLNQKKHDINNDSAKKNELKNKEETCLQLTTHKIAPLSPVDEPEPQTKDSDEDNENPKKWIDGIKKCISTMSIARAIDLVALWLFIFIFVLFNIDMCVN